MCDGLEVSEAKLSELEFSFRIDSEYYQKKFIQYEEHIDNFDKKKLSEIANFLIGPFGSAYDTSRYIEKPGYRYVRGQDVKPFFLSPSDSRYMTKQDFESLNKYSLKTDDILISVVGTLGNASIISKKDLPAIFSCKSSVIRCHDINPYFLVTYFNSQYGRELLLRSERGAIQKGLNLDDRSGFGKLDRELRWT